MLKIRTNKAVFSMQTGNVISLMLKPAITYDNIFARRLKLYHWVFGKDKYKPMHLSMKGGVLQPKRPCDDWRNRGRLKFTQDEIQACDWEVMESWCYDDFTESCLRNLNPAMDERRRLNSELKEFEMSIVMLIREQVAYDSYTTAWFGDERTQSFVDSGEYDLTGTEDMAEKKSWIEQMEHCNGWWYELQMGVEYETIKYVDTNDGTVGGNALNPANIANYLRQMRRIAHPILKNWNLNGTAMDRPYFLLQPDLFDALRELYESLGTSCCVGMDLLMNGEATPGMMMFEGNYVLNMSEWAIFDNTVGAIQADGRSLNQRALFVAPQVLTGLANAKNIDNGFDAALLVERSPVLSDKGRTVAWASLSFGFGVVHHDLVVAGWNSSDTYSY